MDKKDKFLEAWKTSVSVVREVFADQFREPEFHLDYDSKDAKEALDFILRHNFLDTVLEAEPKGKEAFVEMFNDLSAQGQSDLEKFHKRFKSLVKPIMGVLRDEILMKRALDCDYFNDFDYPHTGR